MYVSNVVIVTHVNVSIMYETNRPAQKQRDRWRSTLEVLIWPTTINSDSMIYVRIVQIVIRLQRISILLEFQQVVKAVPKGQNV